jgi:hypothetical protein
MNQTLHAGVIIEVAGPYTYRVRLDGGHEVLARPSRLHFGHRPDDLEYLQSLRPEVAVTVRVTSGDPAQSWLVRTARTDEEWHSSSDPALLLESVRDAASGRKLRLFACACCRRIWDLLPDGPHRRLVEVIEACADGRASAAELTVATAAGDEEEKHVSAGAEDAEHDPLLGPQLGAAAKAVWAVRIAAHSPARGDVFEVALDAARSCAEAAGLQARGLAVAAPPASGVTSGEAAEDVRASAEAAAHRSQAMLVRELFGNPFRPVRADSGWVSPGVVALARTMYEASDFDRFPELAVAVEAAGCTEGEVVGHCRTRRPHARGCWVLDLILGQS